MRLYSNVLGPIAFAGWAMTILWLSLDPSPPDFEAGLLSWDKFQHAAAFGILALLGGIVFSSRCRRPDLAWGLAFAVAVGFGVLVEVAQMSLTSVRSAEWSDLFADGIGAAVACTLGRFGRTFRRTL